MTFLGIALDTLYARSLSARSYLGLEELGMFCNSPLQINSYYSKAMKDPDYSCNSSELPFNYPNWKSKDYSPLCRPWFKE